MEFIALIVIIAVAIIVQNNLYSKYGLKNVHYNCYFSTIEAYEGDEIEIVEEISNRKLLPLPWLKAEISTSKWLDFAGTQSVITDKTRFVSSFFMLKSYHKVMRKWKVKCLKRGVFTLDKVVLVASDLFGNVTISKPVEVTMEITVLPKPIELEELSISSKHMSGDLVVKRHLIADPFYIAGVREYNYNDSMNKINWLATAKEKKIMVYQNDYTTSQSVAVILNIQSREFEGTNIVEEAKVENCIRICASYFDSTIASGLPIRFLANAPVGNLCEPVISNEFAGIEHVLNLFRTLANIKLSSTEDFNVFLANVYDNISSTDIILVTSYINDEILEFSRRKSYHGVSVKILTLDTIPNNCDCEVYSLINYFNKKGTNDEDKTA